MIKIGLIGCGKVAEHHLKYIKKIDDCRITGISDLNEETSKRLGNKFKLDNVVFPLNEFFNIEYDVVHITTPPDTHFELAKKSIYNGANVFIEKPMTLYPIECEELYNYAESKNLKVCPNFIQLFHPNTVEAIKLIDNNEFGRVLFCESHLGLNLDLKLLSEPINGHWSYNLPFGILQNYLTHQLYLIMRFINNPNRICTITSSFNTLPQNLTDHIEVFLSNGEANGYIRLTNAGRQTYGLNIYCEFGSIFINYITSSILVDKKNDLPSVIQRGFTDFGKARKLFANNFSNISKFILGRVKSYQGLDLLISEFYSSIKEGKPSPISNEFGKNVAYIENKILKEIPNVKLNSRNKLNKDNKSQKKKILVTGASGYLGSYLTKFLVKSNYDVRAFIRKTSLTNNIDNLPIEVFFGDIRNYEQLNNACNNIDIVIHSAAGLSGTKDYLIDVNSNGIKNLLKIFEEKKIEKLLYISTQSIYDFHSLKNQNIITETTQLEKYPERRGLSTLSKYLAEVIAIEEIKNRGKNITIIRPSLIFGNNRDFISLIGTKIGKFLLIFGNRNKVLRLIHINDLCEAIKIAINFKITNNKIYNISSSQFIKNKEVISILNGDKKEKILPIYIPLLLIEVIILVLKVLHIASNINLRRFTYLYRNVFVSSDRFRNETGWNSSECLHTQIKQEI